MFHYIIEKSISTIFHDVLKVMGGVVDGHIGKVNYAAELLFLLVKKDMIFDGEIAMKNPWLKLF